MKLALNKLASEIAKREAGKSNVKIGDIRQILKVISEIHAEALIKHGKRPTAVLSEYSRYSAAKIKKSREVEAKKLARMVKKAAASVAKKVKKK
jgi:hypothetical protein